MEQPLISIILPTHNRAELLPLALNSLLGQSYANWEVVVVDDGSTDDTLAVIKSIPDPRIKYHYQENRQLNGARNTGISLAKGAFLGFLDDDDQFLPDHLELLVTAIMKDQFRSAIYRSGEILEGNGKRSLGHNYRNDQDILPQFWAYPTGMFGMLLAAELVREHPFDEEHILLDDFLWLNPILRDNVLHQIDAHTAVVQLHPHQRSATYLTEELLHKNIERLLQAYNLPGIPQRVSFDLYRKQALHQYFHFSRQLVRNGQPRKALGAWKRGLSYANLGDWKDAGKTFAKIILKGSR